MVEKKLKRTPKSTRLKFCKRLKSSWRRILIRYSFLVLITPFFALFCTSISLFFINAMIEGIRSEHFISFFYKFLILILRLVPYLIFLILFTFFYLLIPYKRIPVFSAFLGGVIGGSIYLIIQWGYIYIQGLLNQIGTIYGGFAALPLFLIWIKASWLSFLYGIEISFAHQTIHGAALRNEKKG